MLELALVPSLADDPRSVYRDLRSLSRGVNRAVCKLDVDWPDAAAFLAFLCSYVTEMLHVDGQPILFASAREEALTVYTTRSVATCRKDRHRLNVFLSALLQPICAQLAGTGVRDPADGSVWRADLGETLREWIEEGDRRGRLASLQVVSTDVPRRRAAALLDETILPCTDCCEWD
jgi:hypothetical protein